MKQEATMSVKEAATMAGLDGNTIRYLLRATNPSWGMAVATHGKDTRRRQYIILRQPFMDWLANGNQQGGANNATSN